MPDTPPNPATPQTPAPSSPIPPSGTPTKDSPEVANMVAPEYRYPDDPAVPEYLRGKTASDAAQLLQGLVEGMGRGAAQAPAVPQQDLSTLAADEYVTKQHLGQAQQAALAQVNPWLQTVADQQATFAYGLAKRDEEEVFAKYEPEIIKVLQAVPRQNWTLDAIKNAVTFVKGKHVQELVTDKVRQLEATMGSTMRSTGRAGSTSGSPNRETIEERLAKTPAEWQAHAKAVRITDEQVREFCAMNDLTPDEFFKQFGSGIVTDAVEDVSYGTRASE